MADSSEYSQARNSVQSGVRNSGMCESDDPQNPSQRIGQTAFSESCNMLTMMRLIALRLSSSPTDGLYKVVRSSDSPASSPFGLASDQSSSPLNAVSWFRFTLGSRVMDLGNSCRTSGAFPMRSL